MLFPSFYPTAIAGISRWHFGDQKELITQLPYYCRTRVLCYPLENRTRMLQCTVIPWLCCDRAQEDAH